VGKCYNGCTLWNPVFFCSFINGLTPRYPELFDDYGRAPSEAQIRFGKKWKAYQSVINLSNNDITKFKAILKTPLEEALLFLAYQTDFNELQATLHQESMKKIRS
jgi:hypothetical protein